MDFNLSVLLFLVVLAIVVLIVESVSRLIRRLINGPELDEKEVERIREERERLRREEDERRLAEELARQKAIQEKNQARINHLKAIGEAGYYEYKVISIADKKGAVDIEAITAELNDLGLDGWQLQCGYTNEMGKNSLSIAGFGRNYTSDQNVLILKRFIKFE